MRLGCSVKKQILGLARQTISVGNDPHGGLTASRRPYGTSTFRRAAHRKRFGMPPAAGVSTLRCFFGFLLLVVGTVHGAPAPEPLSRFTSITFSPDGHICEFINVSGDCQEYFIVDPILEVPVDPDFGAIKASALLTPGVFVTRDNSPLPGAGNEAGQTGHRDRPGASGTQFLPTGFNLGRVFAAYNPDAYGGEGAYFLAMDISAPAAMDSVAATQPIAFDVDGDGSRHTQTEINPGAVPEAPSRITLPDIYGFEIDTDGDGLSDVAIFITERRQALQFGSVAIDPNGVEQVIDGVVVRRAVLFEDLTGTLPGTPTDQALFFLDANSDGVLNFSDFGIDADVELVIRNVGALPNNLDPACISIKYIGDSFDDKGLGGGAEELVRLNASFPVPEIEVIKEARCVGEPDSAFRHEVNVTPGSEVEFRITIANWGNRDLNVSIDDTLGCVAPATATLIPASCLVLSAPPEGLAADFCNLFETAMVSNGFPLTDVVTLAAADACAVGLGEQLVFTFLVLIGPESFNASLCDDDVDCTNGVSVSATMTELIDPILPPSPPTPDSPDADSEEQHCADQACCVGIAGCIPGDGIGDVPDEFIGTTMDEAGVIDTVREGNSGLGDDNRVEIEVDCRAITLIKEVRVPPGGTFGTLLDAADVSGAPVSVEYRYTLHNNGELEEEITLSEGFLCDDINTLMAMFPGEVAYGSCPLCTGPTKGVLTTTIASGAPPFTTSCLIGFQTERVLQAFVEADDGRSVCQALTPTGAPDETCYRNCTAASATATINNNTCRDGEITSESFATVCHAPCELTVIKQARCLNNCTEKTPIGLPHDILRAVQGSCVEFRIDITNTSKSIPLCGLRIVDALIGQPNNIMLDGTARFAVGAVECTVPAGFNVAGAPFLWYASTDCGLSALQPGQTLTITLNAKIPDGATPGVTPANTVLVEGATSCPDEGPSFSCDDSASAAVEIANPGLTCLSKEWAFEWDSDADCQLDEPSGDFSVSVDLQDKVFPVRLRLRVKAENTGDVPLNVVASDDALSACVEATPGVSFLPSPACELGTAKPVAPGAMKEWLCDILIESADASRALDACDGVEDGVYNNSASVSGTVSTDANGICVPQQYLVEGSNGCSAQILVPDVCEMTLTKDVKCVGDPDTAFAASVETLPGSGLTYRIRLENTSTLVRIPQVCLQESLSCSAWLVSGTVVAELGGDDVTACIASVFEAAITSGMRHCYTFALCRPAAPWINPGETLSIRFDVAVPPDFTADGANPDCTNEIAAQVFEDVCESEPAAESACAEAVGSAQFTVTLPGLECRKVACPDLNNNGVCDRGSVTDLILPANVEFPFSVIYRVYVQNSGETPLAGVEVCDEQLVLDALAAGLSIGVCELNGGANGCSDAFTLAPGATEVRKCQLTVPSRDAWDAFTTRDDDGDPRCHSNTSRATGTADSATVCDGSGALEITSPGCTARVCIPPPLTGGCCNAEGVCIEETEEECAEDGFTYLGDDTMCLGDNDGDGRDDACQALIPTVSEWGLVIMVLLLLTAAKIHFRETSKRVNV